MRSTFLLTAFAALATLTSASPVRKSDSVPAHTNTPISLETDFITKLEAMFRGEYTPPGFAPSAAASSAKAAKEDGTVSIMGDLFPGAAGPETTRNDLNEGKCGPAILIYARGTTQPGNIGDQPGVKFARDFAAAIPGGIVQGVLPYSADVFGYLAGGSAQGAQSMANLVQKAASQCPTSKIILSGYSQGAQVVHKAANLIPSGLYSKISSIVLYGDPKEGDRFPGTLNNNVLTICNDGDLICDGLPLPFGNHQGDKYEPTVPRAVAYIKARV